MLSEIDPEVLTVFSNWDWPGNIRELRNVMERAIQMSDKHCIRVNDLPDYLVEAVKLKPMYAHSESRLNIIKMSKDGVERKMIESMLHSNNWNKSKPARKLGISRSLLYSLIQKYDLRR